MSATDPFGLIGQVLDGQFRVDALIGEGGFSAVYRGMHLGLDEPIALKCLTVQAALGPAVVESLMKRFREESRLLYRLSQGNLDIVRSIASGTTTSPVTGAMVPYMVLEWLEGRSLASELIVRRTRGATGRPMHEAIALLDSAVDALAYAHSLGVVHRDLNPGNLFLAETRTGTRMKVLDFGVAKVMRDEVLALGPRAQTLQSIRIFSPAYAAPEQYDERIGAVSAATDVWSLAIIMTEVMSDRAIFDGVALGEFFQKVLDPSYPRTPRAHGLRVGDATEKVFARAVAMSPLERQKDAGEFWAQLRIALSKDVGGETVKSSSNPFQPATSPDQIVVVPAPVPAAPMTTTLRVDNSFTYEATELSAVKPAPSPAAHPMSNMQTTMRMAPRPAESPQARVAPNALFQAAPVAPPAEPSESTAIRARPSRASGILVAVVVFVVLVAAAAVAFAVYRARVNPSEIPPTMPSASTSETPPLPSSMGAPSALASVSATPSASAAPEASTTASAPAATAATGMPTGGRPNPKAFNAKAARTALAVPGSILSACKDRGGKTGPGVAHVTFANDGTVALVTIDKPPYAGTDEADCISSKLKRAKMAPFEGPPGTVDYAFSVAR